MARKTDRRLSAGTGLVDHSEREPCRAIELFEPDERTTDSHARNREVRDALVA